MTTSSGSLLITAATLADGTRGDLFVSDGVLADPASAPAGVERFDADGLLALPGLVDLHTHLRLSLIHIFRHRGGHRG